MTQDQLRNESVAESHASDVPFFPSEEDVVYTATQLLESFSLYLKQAEYPDDVAIAISNRSITDIVVRVLKREEYYRYFHGIQISEAKRTGLTAYWIVKLRPFMIVDDRFEHEDATVLVNERFAAFLLVCSTCITLTPDEIDEIRFDSDFIDKLIYSFRYRNISIDAFVLLAESLTPASFAQAFSENVSDYS